MFGGVNPKQMQAMMKKMGIHQEAINARRVVFETDEGDYIIDDPSVLKILMQGQESYQVTGTARFQEHTELFNESDIAMIMEQTNMDRELVIESLEKHDGDIAATIIALKG